MDPSFTRALQKIPAQLRERPGARFTVIHNGGKKPEGKNWAGVNGANYAIDDAPLAGYLSQGHNYGVLCGHAGIAVPDLDDPAALEELGVLARMPNVMQVRTGRGGYHYYLDCPELDNQIGIYHPTLKDEDGEPIHLGEIQSRGQQVVGPGSTHPNGRKYEVVCDAPVLSISKADLLKIFDGCILTGLDDPEEEPRRAEARRRSSGGSSLGDRIPIDAVAWPKAVKEQHGSEVRGSHPIHGSDSGKNFAVNTSKNCWHCFRHKSGGGPLEWIAVETGLISCQDAKPGCLDDMETFKKVLQIARDSGFDIPAPERKKQAEKPQEPNVLTALQKLLDNEDKIKGECLWNWRTNKPRVERVLADGYLLPKGEEKAHKFLKQFEKVLKELGIDYFDLHPLLLKPKDNKEEFSEEIREKALDVLKHKNPVQFVVNSCKRFVLGAEKAIEKLECGISVQNINQSAGLHSKLSGESSGGKTYTVYCFAHHLPSEMVIKGSMSAKAGFYHKDGNRVVRILDDYQEGNEDMDTVIKQTSSDFHKPYVHRTTIKQQAATLEIGSEQTWLVTSVDASQDIQVLNRQNPINVNDSIALTKEVNDHTIQRYGEGLEQRPTDETVLICRCIFQILRDADYIDVIVPFWERIKWLDTSNRRNPELFMDMVIAFTGMNRYQREKDAEGRYMATEADFQAAKALFTDNDAEELVKRLSGRERDLLNKLVAHYPEGYTRDELAELMKVAPQRVSQILKGQKGNAGLMQKVQIAETKKSESEVRDKGLAEEKRVTVYKTIYTLKDYDKLAGFDAVVRLEPAPSDTTKAAKTGRKQDESKDTESSKDRESKESKKKEEREEERDLQALQPDESTLSCENENKAFVAFAVELDSEKEAFAGFSPDLPGFRDGPTMGKIDRPTPTKQRVKFRTDYKTDLDGEMHEVHPGDVAEVSSERAESWIKRGVAEAA